jgi:hypothetical protein
MSRGRRELVRERYCGQLQFSNSRLVQYIQVKACRSALAALPITKIHFVRKSAKKAADGGEHRQAAGAFVEVVTREAEEDWGQETTRARMD